MFKHLTSLASRPGSDAGNDNKGTPVTRAPHVIGRFDTGSYFGSASFILSGVLRSPNLVLTVVVAMPHRRSLPRPPVEWAALGPTDSLIIIIRYRLSGPSQIEIIDKKTHHDNHR